MTTAQSVDLVSAMVGAAADAVATTSGTAVQVGRVVGLSAVDALSAGGVMINRVDLNTGDNGGSLLTLVPAGGLVTAEVSLDAVALTNALVTGAATGIATAGGPLFQVSSPQLIASASSIDTTDAEAIAFDLIVGTKVVTVIWVVEATLGSLLAGPVPVDGSAQGEPSVAPAMLPDLDRAAMVPADRPIEVLADVSTRVSVEIGRGRTQVMNLVSMGPGSIFELDREAGDAVDVLVNGSMVGKGDIVVVGKQLGVRITKVCGVDE